MKSFNVVFAPHNECFQQTLGNLTGEGSPDWISGNGEIKLDRQLLQPQHFYSASRKLGIFWQ